MTAVSNIFNVATKLMSKLVMRNLREFSHDE